MIQVRMSTTLVTYIECMTHATHDEQESRVHTTESRDVFDTTTTRDQGNRWTRVSVSRAVQ